MQPGTMVMQNLYNSGKIAIALLYLSMVGRSVDWSLSLPPVSCSWHCFKCFLLVLLDIIQCTLKYMHKHW